MIYLWCRIVQVFRIIIFLISQSQVVFIFVINRIEVGILCRIAIAQDDLLLLLQLVQFIRPLLPLFL